MYCDFLEVFVAMVKLLEILDSFGALVPMVRRLIGPVLLILILIRGGWTINYDQRRLRWQSVTVVSWTCPRCWLKGQVKTINRHTVSCQVAEVKEDAFVGALFENWKSRRSVGVLGSDFFFAVEKANGLLSCLKTKVVSKYRYLFGWMSALFSSCSICHLCVILQQMGLPESWALDEWVFFFFCEMSFPRFNMKTVMSNGYDESEIKEQIPAECSE